MRAKDLSELIDAVTVTEPSSTDDLLVEGDSTEAARPFEKNTDLNLELAYTLEEGPAIKEGDALSVQLVPLDEAKDFIWMTAVDSVDHALVDSSSGEEHGDVRVRHLLPHGRVLFDEPAAPGGL